MLRATRIAVILSLIVAMTLQPATLQAWVRGCGVRSNTGSNAGHGCGCCANAEADQACCCCTPEPASEANELEASAGSCCGTQGEQTADTSVSDTSRSAKQLVPSAALPDKPFREREDGQPICQEEDTDSAEISAISNTCRCVSSPEPGEIPWNPRLRFEEIRDLLACNVLSCTVLETGCRPPKAVDAVSERPCLPTHFSQVSLCVWRL